MTQEPIRSIDFPEASALAEVLVHFEAEPGNAASRQNGRMSLGLFRTIVGSSQGPAFELKSQLDDDLDWGARTIGTVAGDPIEIFRGFYRKEGSAGSGSWTRIGPLSLVTLANAFEWRGEWTTTTAYEFLDLVRVNGSSYVCLAAHTSALATKPPTGASWETYWALYAARGEDGIDGADGTNMRPDHFAADEAERDTDYGNHAAGTIVLVKEPESPLVGPHIFRLITPDAVTPVWSDGIPFGASLGLATSTVGNATLDGTTNTIDTGKTLAGAPLLVFVDGAPQRHGTHFTTSGTEIVFSEAPQEGAWVMWALAGDVALVAAPVETDGTLSADSDAVVPSQRAVKAYVDALIGASDAMVFKGVLDCSANPDYPGADCGHTYRVSVAGKVGGGSGVSVEAGDLLLCLTDATASGNHATVGADWSIAQANLDGAVIGPASVTDSRPAFFDGTSGKLLKQGPVSRELLTAARTYYVRTDGSDANTGLADSAGGAFVTLQKAIDTAVALDLDVDVTIQMRAGTYTAGATLKTVVGAGKVIIKGESGVIISTTSASCITSDGSARGTYEIDGIKLQTTTTGAGIFARGAGLTVRMKACEFGAIAGAGMAIYDQAFLLIVGNYAISGAAGGHLEVSGGGVVNRTGAITVTITGTPAIALFAYANGSGSNIVIAGFTFSGSATGVRYLVDLNASINTAGGGASYLPGNSGGSTATGGEYA